MPPEDEKTTIAGKEGASKETAPKKGKGKLFLFAGIGLGIVVVGVALALFVLKPMLAGSGDNADKTTQVDGKSAASGEQAAKPEQKKKPRRSGEHGEEGRSLVYAIKDIVVNPAGTGGTRFLSVSFGFELGSPELRSEFEEREAVVRDALITILSSKTVAQLTDAKEKEIARLQIKKRLEQLMTTTDIAGVYYTDFVLQ
ncbi:MAG: flagellar basal body-associated FliL family protein [Candidatus Zixiibacteriota bacterium]